jgi:hypothetical protein
MLPASKPASEVVQKMSDKKIVYESRTKVILLMTGVWAFTIASILTGYVWGIIFFGLAALVTTYPLVDPKKRIFFIGTKEYKNHFDKAFKARLVDKGVFEYCDNGFIISLERSQKIEWIMIQTIFAYKIDLMTIDEVCIDVFCDNNVSFRLTEETAGWYVFLKRLQEQFPTIDNDWSAKIEQPAFATNLTLVYDRDSRTCDHVARLLYNDKKKVE